MNHIINNKNEEIIMKLLHYFITEKNYNPVVLHGSKDEIWLENLHGDYKIIRLISNYIHNEEQLQYDLYKTNQIMKTIKKKTLSFNIPTLNIFLNLGDSVELKWENLKSNNCIKIEELKDLNTGPITNIFPDINKTLEFKEKGMELFLKITNDINKKTSKDAMAAEETFKPKQPSVTYVLLAINILMFILMYVLGNGSEDNLTLLKFGANNRYLVVTLKQYYRLIASAFLHIGIIHLFFNCYALKIIGSQVESFYGKWKYLIIYLGSAICGSLLSITTSNYTSAGASGALFGLLGSILYFGYHYRIYLGNVLKSQIIPLIIFNLFISLLPGIDASAHIGGLIGGILISMAVGVKNKTTKTEQINGVILTLIFVGFMIYLLFFS